MAEEETAEVVPNVNLAIDAPVFFVDGVMIANAFNGVVRMTFGHSVADPVGSPNSGWKTRNVVTLAITENGFASMLEYLTKTAETMKEQGLIGA